MASGVHGDEVQPVIISSQAEVGSGAGYVHWITISNTHATLPTAVELNDSSDDSGTDRWGVTVEAIDFLLLPFHVAFDPPIKFSNAIFCDITGGTAQVTVGRT